MSIDLTSKGMLVSLSISVFSGEKKDASITEEIAAKHNVRAYETGKFTKQIISRHSLEPIRKVAGAARERYYTLTLPWSDVGGRLLSTTGFLDYSNEMRSLKNQFFDEIRRFVTAYPDLIEEARKRLNGMFDADDYPPVESLMKRFEFTSIASPLPNTSNWVLDLANEEMEVLRTEAEARVNSNVDIAVKDTYRRVAEVTSRMAERLRAYDDINPETQKPSGLFRDSLVTNVLELVDILPGLNITEDPTLTEISKDLQQLCRFDPKSLRAEPTFRKMTVTAADAILAKVQGLF